MGTWRNKITIALSAVAVVGIGAIAWAADLNTINNTESYADPANAALFMVTPSDCAAAPDATDNVLACNALGDLAVQAIQGLGPMNYFQGDSTLEMAGTNYFVPSNFLWNTLGGQGGGTSPIFANNPRTLFGSGSEALGKFTRAETLFYGLATGVSGYDPQTNPGNDTIMNMIIFLLTEPEGNTTITVGGQTFNYSDLPTYFNITGFSSGKATTIYNNCLLSYTAVQCAAFGPVFQAQLYLADQNIIEAFPTSCGVGDAFCADRNEWIDQTVVGYVTSLDKDTAAQELTQNFRSQISFEPIPTDISTFNRALLDQRLEQSVELGMAEYEASRQTLQQAYQSESTGASQFPPFLQWSQLVSQDVEGYLFSCANCDTPELIGSGGSHAFEPYLTTDQITFIPYWSNWHTVPTITHAPAQ